MGGTVPRAWRPWVWQPSLPLPVPLCSYDEVIRRSYEALATTLPRRGAWL